MFCYYLLLFVFCMFFFLIWVANLKIERDINELLFILVSIVHIVQ